MIGRNIKNEFNSERISQYSLNTQTQINSENEPE
jgi:hypothetical protein